MGARALARTTYFGNHSWIDKRDKGGAEVEWRRSRRMIRRQNRALSETEW